MSVKHCNLLQLLYMQALLHCDSPHVQVELVGRVGGGPGARATWDERKREISVPPAITVNDASTLFSLVTPAITAPY